MDAEKSFSFRNRYRKAVGWGHMPSGACVPSGEYVHMGTYVPWGPSDRRRNVGGVSSLGAEMLLRDVFERCY